MENKDVYTPKEIKEFVTIYENLNLALIKFHCFLIKLHNFSPELFDLYDPKSIHSNYNLKEEIKELENIIKEYELNSTENLRAEFTSDYDIKKIREIIKAVKKD